MSSEGFLKGFLKVFLSGCLQGLPRKPSALGALHEEKTQSHSQMPKAGCLPPSSLPRFWALLHHNYVGTRGNYQGAKCSRSFRLLYELHQGRHPALSSEESCAAAPGQVGESETPSITRTSGFRLKIKPSYDHACLQCGHSSASKSAHHAYDERS